MLRRLVLVLHGADLPAIDSLWDYSKPAESEARFREVLPRAADIGTIDYQAELQTQIARSLALQRKFDSAHLVLNDVEPLLDRTGPRARVRYDLERGRTYNSSGAIAAADSLFV